MKCFAVGLVFKQRQKAPQKWPIAMEGVGAELGDFVSVVCSVAVSKGTRLFMCDLVACVTLASVPVERIRSASPFSAARELNRGQKM